MVLVHKIIQMQQLHMDYGLSEEDNHPPEAPADEKQQPKKNDKESPSVVSGPERPRTRSQTSSLPPARRPDDVSPSYAIRKPTTAKRSTRQNDSAEKRMPSTTPSSSTSKRLKDKPSGSETAAPSAQRPSSRTPSQTQTAMPTLPPPPATEMENAGGVSNQYTFLDTSTISTSDRRGPRARAAPPIPVPNLTKKSRGRRVPTKVPPPSNSDAVLDGSTTPVANRVYVCKVESCGKCFNRGEHLKRHIRSIHTYEKPFKCDHPGCGKFFNRHDNLLQHLKVHKVRHHPNHSNEGEGPQQSSAPHPPPILQLHFKPHFAQLPDALPFRSMSGLSSQIDMVAPPRFSHHRDYASLPESGLGSTRGGSFASSNMAISSLRTELPHSPIEDMERGVAASPSHIPPLQHIISPYVHQQPIQLQQASFERGGPPPAPTVIVASPVTNADLDEMPYSGPRLLPHPTVAGAPVFQ